MENLSIKAKLLRGLSDPSRLCVLETLRNGPRTVTDLLKVTGLRQPNLSMHLACLRECGLVRASRNARYMFYELADDTVNRLLETADILLLRVRDRIEACPRYEKRATPSPPRKRRPIQKASVRL